MVLCNCDWLQSFHVSYMFHPSSYRPPSHELPNGSTNGTINVDLPTSSTDGELAMTNVGGTNSAEANSRSVPTD